MADSADGRFADGEGYVTLLTVWNDSGNYRPPLSLLSQSVFRNPTFGRCLIPVCAGFPVAFRSDNTSLVAFRPISCMSYFARLNISSVMIRRACAHGVMLLLLIGVYGCRTVSDVVTPEAAALNWLTPFSLSDAAMRFSVDLEQLRAPAAPPIVHQGDLLELTVWDLYEPGIPHTSPLRVDSQGRAAPPLLEDLNLGGLSVSEAEKLLIDKYQAGEILLQPRVMVRRLETTSCNVQIIGGVERPGMVKLPHDQATVYHAILAAGGLKRNTSEHWLLTRYPPRAETSLATEETGGGVKTVSDEQENAGEVVSTLDTAQLRTPTEERTFDLSKPQELQDLKSTILRDGDVLRIPEASPPLRITGVVKKPGNYPMEESQSLSIPEAIDLAGGLLLPTLPGHAVVTRPIPGGQNVERWSIPIVKGELSGDAPALMPGDLLHIEMAPHEQVKQVIGGLRHRKSLRNEPEETVTEGDQP